jgi:hypothetical protein
MKHASFGWRFGQWVINITRLSKTQLGILIGIVVLMSSTLIVVRAQTPVCRDVGNLTICGNELAEIDSSLFGGGFAIRGNLTIGPKGLPPVVRVVDIGSIFEGEVVDAALTSATYFHFNQLDTENGSSDYLIGDVRFINDPTNLPLLGSAIVRNPSPTGARLLVGRLFVDPVNRKIFAPAAGAVPVFERLGVVRNSNINLAFVGRVGAFSFYKNGGSVNERALVDGEFDLNTKRFKGIVPIDLKLDDSSENPNLRITMRAEFSDNGTFSGTVDGFKYRLGGLIMEASGVIVKLATATAPAEFEAALVKVLKTDNPDVPTLDPTDPTLIFSFTKLKYKNAKFEIGGVEVPVKDWEFGSAFKMTNQTLGLVNEGVVQSIQIKSTLTFFGDDGDPKRKVPLIMKIGRVEVAPGEFRPTFSAGLQAIAPKIGTMTFKLQNAVFSGNPQENFWGIKASSAALQWPDYLGNQTAAGINDFKIGVELDTNKNKKFKVALGGGTFSLPPFENQVFKGTLGATLGVISDTMVITGTGTFNLKLPGNANSAGVATNAILRYGKGVADSTPAPPSTTIGPCRKPAGVFAVCPGTQLAATTSNVQLKEFDLKLSGFSLKLAGFGLTITNPSGLDDGGFAADDVAATLPAGIVFDNIGSGTQNTNGITIQGLVVKGVGDITIQGGGFEIAPITFGGYQFVGLKGNFVKLPEGGFEFKAGGKLPLPGLEPGANSGGIGAEVRIRTKPDNSVDGFGVSVTFTAGGAIPKIKMPGTGMSLVSITGSFDVKSGTTTIGVNLVATSDLAIPLGSLGSLPIAKAEGNVLIQAPPAFKINANARLSILIFQVANASINIGQGYGFAGGSGLEVNFTINTLFIDGSAHLRIGEVTLSNGTKKIRVQGDATVAVVVPKKLFAGLPREDRTLASVSVGFGRFTDTRNDNRESAGVLAMGELAVVGSVGAFLDMGANPIDVIFFKNDERFQAVPQALVHQRAQKGVMGYSTRTLNRSEAAQLLNVDAAQRSSTIQQDTVPYSLSAPTRLLMGIEYTGTLNLAAIRLKLPDGTILSKATVNGTTQTYGEESDAQGGVLLFVLQNAPIGNYQLLIDNPPANYTANILELNQMPTGSITSDTCGGAAVRGVTVVCPGTPRNTGQVSFSWNASDLDTPSATVDVGYVKVVDGKPDNTTFAALEVGRPLGNGSAIWDLSEVPTGVYQVMIEVSNDSGPAVRAYGSQLITITDKRAPAVPTGLNATPLANELSITWTQNSERDLAGYEIGLGVVDPNQADAVNRFFYLRSMGPKEVITGTNSLVDAKLWGIPDNTEVFFGIRAYDSSGNFSDWTPLQRGRPWALSPNTWNPVPNGAGTGFVEVAFDTPLNVPSLANALVVRNAQGQIVAGQSYLLTDQSGQNIIGIGFAPNQALSGPVSATLKGGPNGVRSGDGRIMGEDYSWSFTMSETSGKTTFLPVVLR